MVCKRHHKVKEYVCNATCHLGNGQSVILHQRVRGSVRAVRAVRNTRVFPTEIRVVADAVQQLVVTIIFRHTCSAPKQDVVFPRLLYHDLSCFQAHCLWCQVLRSMLPAFSGVPRLVTWIRRCSPSCHQTLYVLRDWSFMLPCERERHPIGLVKSGIWILWDSSPTTSKLSQRPPQTKIDFADILTALPHSEILIHPLSATTDSVWTLSTWTVATHHAPNSIQVLQILNILIILYHRVTFQMLKLEE